MVCPNCGAQATAVANKPYCTRCGWNINSAANAVRLKANAILALALLVAGLLGYRAFLRAGNAAFAIAAAIVLCATVPLYHFLRGVPLAVLERLRASLSIAPPKSRPWIERQTRREVIPLDGQGSAAGPANRKAFEFRVRAEPPGATSQAEPATLQEGTADERLRRLDCLPVPRDVRITRRGILYALLGVPAVLGLAGLSGCAAWKGAISAGSLSAFSQQEWVAVFTAFFFFGISVHVLRKLVWDRRLLVHGAVTVGRVVGQRTGGRFRRSSTITYTFSDAASRVFTSGGTDYSTEYYEGMWVVVFYDPLRPHKCVAEGGALYSLDAAPRSE